MACFDWCGCTVVVTCITIHIIRASNIMFIVHLSFGAFNMTRLHQKCISVRPNQGTQGLGRVLHLRGL